MELKTQRNKIENPYELKQNHNCMTDVPLISSYSLILSSRVVLVFLVYLGISAGALVHAQ